MRNRYDIWAPPCPSNNLKLIRELHGLLGRPQISVNTHEQGYGGESGFLFSPNGVSDDLRHC